MSDFMREALPIFFMYGCVLALGPFIAVAMWMAFDGDRLREGEVAAAIDTTEAAVVRTAAHAAPRAGNVTPAA